MHALERFDLLDILKSIKEKTEKRKTDSGKKFTNQIQENCIEILNSSETYTHKGPCCVLEMLDAESHVICKLYSTGGYRHDKVLIYGRGPAAGLLLEKEYPAYINWMCLLNKNGPAQQRPPEVLWYGIK